MSMTAPEGATRGWLLDASIYIFRAWFSLPDRWHSPEGYPLNAVVGYTGFLLDLIEQRRPQAVLGAAFDESLGTCFRHAIYPGYKASRALPDEALAFQLSTCREVTSLLGIPCYGGPAYEADDYLATLARLCRGAGLSVTLLSRDKDLGQLLGEGDELCNPGDGRCLDQAGFVERFGVRPVQFADFQALVGDRIDDIPGVPGVGPRTAARLLQHFPDLDALESGLDTVAGLPLRGAAGLQARLQANWDQVLIARQLTRLEDAVPGLDELPHWSLERGALEALQDRLRALGLAGRLLQRCRRMTEEVIV